MPMPQFLTSFLPEKITQGISDIFKRVAETMTGAGGNTYIIGGPPFAAPPREKKIYREETPSDMGDLSLKGREHIVPDLNRLKPNVVSDKKLRLFM